MKNKLIDEEDFQDKIEELGNDIEEIKILLEALGRASTELKENRTAENFSAMKESKADLEKKIKSAESLLGDLTKSTKNKEVLVKKVEKIQSLANKAIQEYESRRNEFELVIKNNMPTQFAREGSSTISVQSGQGGRRDSFVPTMQAYNQSEFIEKRERDLQQLNQDARDINSLTKDVTGKIYEQDDKLDNINKQLDTEVVGNLEKTNKDLSAAEVISRKRTANYTFFVGIICLGVAVIGATVYFLFK